MIVGHEIVRRAIQTHLSESVGPMTPENLERTRKEFVLQLSRFQHPMRMAFLVLLLMPPGPTSAAPTRPGDLVRMVPLGSTALSVLRSLLTVIALDNAPTVAANGAKKGGQSGSDN